jgi:N-acetylmuramoyl-L-alanine amidase
MPPIVLAIDPGHGMSNRTLGVFDPGATKGTIREADVVLAYALAVRWIAEQEFKGEVRAVLTREDAATPTPVFSRARKAKSLGADAFVSLHLNAGGGTGSEIYIRDKEDKRLADLLAPRIATAVGVRNRGVHHEDKSQHSRLAVLSFDGPACLIELGFVDSPKDAASLAMRETRVAVARAILSTVKELYS